MMKSGIMADMFCLLWLAAITVHSVLAATTQVDVTGPGCDQIDGYYLKNIDDYIAIYAYPQYNTIATRDHCDVTIRADQGRRIEYIIETILFNECGVEIRMYDNPTIDTNPIQIVDCDDNSKVPIQGKTNFNVFRLRVRKTTPESRAFTFTMRLKNDLGPSMQFEKDASKYTGEVLEPGVIAGISIAGGLVVIGLILVGIFLIIRARNSNRKSHKYPADDMPSVYSTGKSGFPPSEIHRQHAHIQEHRRQHNPSTSISVTHTVTSNQWRESDRPPRRMRPPVPMPTQPAPRDPGRKSLSDRHRSGEHTARSTSQTRHTDRRTRETFA